MGSLAQLRSLLRLSKAHATHRHRPAPEQNAVEGLAELAQLHRAQHECEGTCAACLGGPAEGPKVVHHALLGRLGELQGLPEGPGQRSAGDQAAEDNETVLGCVAPTEQIQDRWGASASC